MREGDLTVFQVRGEVAASTMIDAFREFLLDPTRLALWDMRGWAARVDPERLRPVVDSMKRCDRSRRPQAKTAIVCRNEGDANAIRLFVAYAEAEGYPTEMAVFANVTQARRWLAEG
jgi:hypothetical protein